MNDTPIPPPPAPPIAPNDRSIATGQFVDGRYRIEKAIARGGQASVYLATQLPLNRAVALKILTPAETSDLEQRQFQDRFLLEARALAALTHPNIVVIYDYGEASPGRFYIAMEYVTGFRFSELVREGSDPTRILRIIVQVCSALRYAHRQGIVHRDIKNSNILITRDEHGGDLVKVVDFGIAKLLEKDNQLTEAGMILGSPHFIAPEQAKGLPTDHRADIYSVGVLLYCGLVGRYPFDGPNPTSIFTAHVLKEVPPWKPEDLRGIVSAQLERVVRKCLAKEPHDRYSDMDALLNDLRPFTTDAGDSVSVSLELDEESTSPRKARKTPWALVGTMIFLSVLAVITLAVALASWFRSAPAPSPTLTSPPPAAQPIPPPVTVEPSAPVEVPVQPEVAAPPVMPPVATPAKPPPAKPSTPKAATPPTPPPVKAPKEEPKKNTDIERKTDLRNPWEK